MSGLVQSISGTQRHAHAVVFTVDVNPEAVPIWQIVTRISGDTYNIGIAQCARNPIIVVKKID